MALFSRRVLDGPVAMHALTAAASTIDLSDSTEVKRLVKTREKWQELCWEYYDLIGEVKYSSNFLGNACSKLRLIGAVLGEDGEPEPIPKEDKNLEKVAAIVADLRAPIGGQAEILRRAAIGLTVPGECYLVGLAPKPDPDETAGESSNEGVNEWGIYSSDEVTLERGTDTVRLKDGPDGKDARELTDDDFLLRIWLAHARWGKRADSALRGVLAICEELLMLEKAVRAVARSRAAGPGILAVPDEMSDGPPDPTADESDGNAVQDPFLADLIKALVTPIQDEGSASAVVPMIVKGKAEALQHLRHITLDRQVDQFLDTRTERALKRLAQGLNVPPEVVTGLSDVNHWTSWQIEESTFKAHVEPLAIQICDAFTSGYLQPALEEEGIEDPERYLMWFDPSRLVVRPNRVDDAKDLHDRIVISDESLRSAAGFSEADIPNDVERQRREELKRPLARPGSEPAREGDREIPEQPTEPDDDDEAASEASAVEPSRTAAAPRSTLGQRLFEMDRVLRERLSVAADAAMRRAVDRVGARLRSKANKDATLRAAVSQVPNAQVAAALGQNLVASLGKTDDELLEGSFDDLGGQFATWVADVQARALGRVPAMTDSEMEAAAARQVEDRDAAWLWFRSALMDLARVRLYDPDPDAPEVGEYDPTLLVPAGIVREAIARAGGAASPAASIRAGLIDRLMSAELNVLGVATGWLLKELFADKQVLVAGYEWVYGAYPRERPFEPHAALDGLQFENFDDQRLRNFESWPPNEFYLPGDHDGCQCDFMPDMIEGGA